MLIEGEETNNTAQFQVHRLCSELFSCIDGVPFEHADNACIDKIFDLLNKIERPSHPSKTEEFEKSFSDLRRLIESIKSGELRTVYKTRVPYVLHSSVLNLSASWKQLPLRMKLIPSFTNSIGASLVNTNSALLPVGSSRWQSGVTEIELSFSGFIDGALFSETLQATEGHAHPEEGWPKCFAIAFEIINEISWKIREIDGGEQQWIPAPRDLGFMDTKIVVSEGVELFHIVKDPPSNLMRVFTPVEEELDIELGELLPLNWSNKARLLCTMYLDLGDSNESIFWLNVATEALIKERIQKISDEISEPDLKDKLSSPKAFWGDAEEILVKQFPEMAGRVKWPEAQIHISVFGKIKYLYKLVDMKTSVKEVLSHYGLIQSHRNDLFHGVSGVRVPVGVVQDAMASFDWIDKNMVLENEEVP
ncbi:MAG: hypothetical protein BMS9Abin18_0963 [Zetaproteobacteria bacterium]|nr:MAG: hypothetical protein BMS9Abin18_0963 [Zetaproteobacteria bacterium]